MPITSKKKAPRYIRVPPTRYVFQFKVTLRYIKPPIGRRILVPDNLLLGELHDAIYPAMGWYGYPMHCFRFGGRFNPIPEHFDLDAINRRLQPENSASTNEPSRKTE